MASRAVDTIDTGPSFVQADADALNARFAGINAATMLRELFADGSLGWSGMDQLGALLQTVGPRHAELSAQARRFYEANFSREKFQQALAEILAA